VRISKEEYLKLNQQVQELQREFAIIQEILVRIVESQRTISFNFLDEIPDGRIVWDTVKTEAGTKEMTVWFAVNQEQEQNGKVSVEN
jgi:hypothetical protein